MGVQDVLVDVCAALHEEYVTSTGKVRNHKARFSSSPVECSYNQLCTQGCLFAVVSILYTRSAHGTGVLGEEIVAQVCMCTQESSYWSAMLSCTTHSNIKCDDSSQCGRPKAGGFAPANCQSVYVPYCVMDPLHGESQSVSTVIINNATSRVECGKCPHAHLTKREHFVRSPVVLSVFTCAQQVSIALNLLVALSHCLLKQSANCFAKSTPYESTR